MRRLCTQAGEVQWVLVGGGTVWEKNHAIVLEVVDGGDDGYLERLREASCHCRSSGTPHTSSSTYATLEINYKIYNTTQWRPVALPGGDEWSELTDKSDGRVNCLINNKML